MEKQKNNFKIDFIGIGAPRTGTTWTAQCLEEHPQICLSKPKEVHFFTTPKYNYGISWYKKHFFCQPNQIIGEFDAGCLNSKEAAERIKQHFPQIKIIVCLRNPIERAFSNYLSVASFEARDINFEQWLSVNPEMLDRGLYYSHLKNYFNLLPRENILILIYEDIDKDPLKFIKNVFNFLGIDSNFVPNNVTRKRNPSKVYRFPLIKRIIGQTIRYIGSRKYGVNVANFFRKIGLKKLLILIDKIISKPLNQRPQINPTTRKKLQEFYQPEIKKLEKLINRNLSFW